MISDTETSAEEFYKAVLKLKTTEDCKDFFDDLLSAKEFREMVQRICAAKLLIEDKTYDYIIGKTGVSSATLSRISRCVKNGNGYKKVLK